MPTHDLLRSKIAPQDSAAPTPTISVQVLPALNKRSADLEFEIGHVLFIDIVGYSKLLLNEQ
jgi:hypothetical protein